MSITSDILRGHTETIILASLLSHDSYGYKINKDIMKKTGNAIASGDIKISPLDGRESPACKYCDFSGVCGIEDREVPRVPDLKNDEILDAMKEGEKDGV